MIHELFEIHSRKGERLHADLRYSHLTEAKEPILVFLHGFKGFKDWGPIPMMMERLAKEGFVTINFNFSHNGVGEDPFALTELDRFAQTTFTRDLEEVHDVLGAITSSDIPIDPARFDRNRIGIIGHSRGAATAILAASQLASLTPVVALAPVATFERWTGRQAEIWKTQGYVEITNQRTGQVMRLNRGLLEDYEAHRGELDILKAAQKLAEQHKPLLVIVGSEDLTAPIAESEAIANAAKSDTTELAIVPRTGHTFGTEHPFAGMTPAFEKVIELTKEFFTRHLKQ
ncbi:MAG: alpha/beta fold hydrolase [Bacteroidota bacterium]|nr:alpha/beta fold hydrolase [Bacteroidota bacterium]MDP4232276.1 alpha/beta fold hydrolase [Bacteroidota bacterium]MDP4241415.1 alpha/beta fold hydrolase [Bacteroidota bacterium]MDP4286761.1 alpha/beta fold hydrolase [Bacteroidota bacterium]